MTAADTELDEVYGDHVHNNPGEHLRGHLDTDTDKMWQDWHTRIAVLPQLHYHVPTGSVGNRFIEIVASLLDGIPRGHHNMEKFLLFPMHILPRRFNIKHNKDIRKCLTHRMDLWEQGKFPWLVEDTERCLQDRLARFNSQASQQEKLEHFNRLMLQGEVRRPADS
jgi:hypothetical protein